MSHDDKSHPSATPKQTTSAVNQPTAATSVEPTTAATPVEPTTAATPQESESALPFSSRAAKPWESQIDDTVTNPSLDSLRLSRWNNPVDLAVHDAAYPDASYQRQVFVPAPAPIVLYVARDLHLWVEGVDPKGRQFVRDLVDPMRIQFFERWGIHLPPIEVTEDPSMRTGSLAVTLYGTPIITGTARRDYLLVAEHAHRLEFLGVHPEKAMHPIWHRPASWVHREYSHLFVDQPLQTWDCGEFLVMVMSHALQSFSSEFVGIQETQSMLNLLSASWPDLVRHCLEALPLPRLRRVLRLLADENVSLLRLRHILEILVDTAETCRHVESLVDEVRRGLRHHLCHAYTLDNQILAYLLDRELEQELQQIWHEQRAGLPISAEEQQRRNALWSQVFGEISRHLNMIPPISTFTPVILVADARIRRPLHRLIHQHVPWLDVLAFDELDPRYIVTPLATVSAS